MGASRVAVAAGVALVLATARGFVLVPSGLPRPNHSARYSTRSHNHDTGCRIPAVRLTSAPLSCNHSAFAGRTIQPITGAHDPRYSGRSCPEGSGGNQRSHRARQMNGPTMRLGTGYLLPGGGRKLALAGIVNAAAFATVGGGVLSGGLHAVSGPDHLAALLPRIMGQKWHSSMRIGATWGLGHGFSAMVIGLAVSLEMSSQPGTHLLFFIPCMMERGGAGGGRFSFVSAREDPGHGAPAGTSSCILCFLLSSLRGARRVSTSASLGIALEDESTRVIFPWPCFHVSTKRNFLSHFWRARSAARWHGRTEIASLE